MAVQTNPFEEWQETRLLSDYRSRETQTSSLTRQMLRQSSYLRLSNRVNPGPSRNLRALVADSTPTAPHGTCNNDVWGWQRWTQTGEYLSVSDAATNLRERSNTDEIPGCN